MDSCESSTDLNLHVQHKHNDSRGPNRCQFLRVYPLASYQHCWFDCKRRGLPRLNVQRKLRRWRSPWLLRRNNQRRGGQWLGHRKLKRGSKPEPPLRLVDHLAPRAALLRATDAPSVPGPAARARASRLRERACLARPPCSPAVPRTPSSQSVHHFHPDDNYRYTCRTALPRYGT